MNASSSVKCFCLCVSDYLECSCPDVANCPKCTENCVEPPRKRMNLSLKGKNKKDRNCQLQNKENEPDPRFEFLTKEEMDKLQEGYKPDNTTKTTKWAVNNFQAWRVARNKVQEEKCPDDILRATDPAILCKWLLLFVAETRTTQGKPYPPSTLYALLSGLLRHAREVLPGAPNFLDKRDHRFKPLHKLNYMLNYLLCYSNLCCFYFVLALF